MPSDFNFLVSQILLITLLTKHCPIFKMLLVRERICKDIEYEEVVQVYLDLVLRKYEMYQRMAPVHSQRPALEF